MSSSEDITSLPADGRPTHYVGRHVTALARMARAYVDPCVAPFGLTFTLVQILVVLFDGDGISQHDICCRVYIDKGAIARAIKKLAEEGYVTREPDPADDRAYRVLLTEKAWRDEPALKAILRGWTAGATRGLTEDEFALLDGLLTRMVGNAEQLLRDARSAAVLATDDPQEAAE